MNLLDQHFEEALHDIPQKKLSFWANRRMRKMLKQRYYELEGRPLWLIFLPRLVAVPVAFMFLVTSTAAYSFYSPTIIQSDWLYRVKERGELWLYPADKPPEERISYHLWLSDRRYDEVLEILRRKTGQEIVLVPRAKAHGNDDGHDEENGDSLDAILQSTLQRAAENVETAFLVAEEIRDLPTVSVVKEKITIAVKKQQQWLQKSKPVLAQVQLKKTQIERRKRMQAIREQAKQRSVQELAFFPEIIKPESAPSTAPVDLVSQPTDSEAPHPLLPPLPLPFLPVPSLPIFLPEPPSTMDTLMEETIAFQQALLSHMEQAIAVAEERQEQRVKIAFEEFLEPLRKNHLSEVLEIAMEMHKDRIAKMAQWQDEKKPREEKKERKERKERKEKKEEPLEIVGITEPPAEVAIDEALEEAEEPEISKIAEIVSEPLEVAEVEMMEGALGVEAMGEEGLPVKKEKDECEKKADKECEKSDQKDCREKVVKECREEKEKKERKEGKERDSSTHPSPIPRSIRSE